MTTPLNETLGVFARVFLTPDEFYLDGDTRVFNQRGMLYMETPTGFGGRKRTDQMGKTFIVVFIQDHLKAVYDVNRRLWFPNCQLDCSPHPRFGCNGHNSNS